MITLLFGVAISIIAQSKARKVGPQLPDSHQSDREQLEMRAPDSIPFRFHHQTEPRTLDRKLYPFDPLGYGEMLNKNQPLMAPPAYQRQEQALRALEYLRHKRIISGSRQRRMHYESTASWDWLNVIFDNDKWVKIIILIRRTSSSIWPTFTPPVGTHGARWFTSVSGW